MGSARNTAAATADLANAEEDNLFFDIGNLSVVDANPTSGPKENIRKRAEKNTQLLINLAFSLPPGPPPNGPGRLVELPKGTTPCPREKPVPVARQMTKWEKFAQQKGIHKKKKDKMVYDEQTDTWGRRYGHNRANNELDQWAIAHKDGDDPSIDPFLKMELEKRQRTLKNRENQQKNIKAALGKRIPGTLDLQSAISASRTRLQKTPKQKKALPRGVDHLDTTLRVLQHSTASMGLFDREVENEPRRELMKKSKKEEFTLDINTEKKQSLNVLDRILGSPTEKDIVDMDKEVKIGMSKEQAKSQKRKRREKGDATAHKAKKKTKKDSKKRKTK